MTHVRAKKTRRVRYHQPPRTKHDALRLSPCYLPSIPVRTNTSTLVEAARASSCGRCRSIPGIILFLSTRFPLGSRHALHRNVMRCATRVPTMGAVPRWGFARTEMQAQTFPTDGGLQYICTRCVLHISICKPIIGWCIWLSLQYFSKSFVAQPTSYPTYLHPMCIAY